MSAAPASPPRRPTHTVHGVVPGRLVQVTAHYPPYTGGVEVVVQALAREMAQRGTDVEVLTTRLGAAGWPGRDRSDRASVRRYRARSVGGAPVSPGLVAGLMRQPAGALMHVHGPHAFVAELVRLVSWWKGAPYIVHFHLDVAASSRWGRLLPLYKRTLLRGTLCSAARVLTLSEEMADFVHREYAVPLERIGVLPNGVDESFFDVADRGRRDRAGRSGPFRLLFVGRLAPQKNVPRLLEALTRVRSAVDVVVVGDGPDQGELERLARDHGLTDVRFVGRQSREQVVEWLSWADALVSSSDLEGMPLAVLEAMAAGLPVLATDVPGNAALVCGVGLVVPPTAVGLAEGIERLADNAPIRRQMAEAGRARARAHTWAVVCDELEVQYAAALS